MQTSAPRSRRSRRRASRYQSRDPATPQLRRPSLLSAGVRSASGASDDGRGGTVSTAPAICGLGSARAVRRRRLARRPHHHRDDHHRHRASRRDQPRPSPGGRFRLLGHSRPHARQELRRRLDARSARSRDRARRRGTVCPRPVLSDRPSTCLWPSMTIVPSIAAAPGRASTSLCRPARRAVPPLPGCRAPGCRRARSRCGASRTAHRSPARDAEHARCTTAEVGLCGSRRLLRLAQAEDPPLRCPLANRPAAVDSRAVDRAPSATSCAPARPGTARGRAAAEASVRLGEGLLSDVLGIFALAQHAVRHAERQRRRLDQPGFELARQVLDPRSRSCPRERSARSCIWLHLARRRPAAGGSLVGWWFVLVVRRAVVRTPEPRTTH